MVRYRGSGGCDGRWMCKRLQWWSWQSDLRQTEETNSGRSAVGRLVMRQSREEAEQERGGSCYGGAWPRQEVAGCCCQERGLGH